MESRNSYNGAYILFLPAYLADISLVFMHLSLQDTVQAVSLYVKKGKRERKNSICAQSTKIPRKIYSNAALGNLYVKITECRQATNVHAANWYSLALYRVGQFKEARLLLM